MKRPFWNAAPWAGQAASLARRKDTAAFDEIVERLRDLASDPKADPDDARNAEAMLKTIANDQREPADRRNKATQASARVASRRDMHRRMGIQCRVAPYNDGVRQVIPTMTPAEARAFMARKAEG